MSTAVESAPVTPTSDLDEVDIVQNPAFGAAVIWKFGLGYQEGSANHLAPFPLAFLVLPLILHRNTLSLVLRTRKSSGLARFAEQIGALREDLVAVHMRAVSLRRLTLQSIAIGVRAKLLTVDYQNALLRSNPRKLPTTPDQIASHLEGGERVGFWCSKLPIHQVTTLLKVQF